MKSKVLPLVICVLMVCVLFISACKNDDDDNTPVDTTHANQLARAGMTQLNNTILDLQENEPEWENENDLMLEATFLDIQAKFDEALTYDANNPMANLGLSILSIVSLNYDDELWDLIDDIDALENTHKRLLNNQFQFLAQAPLRALTMIEAGKTNPVSMMRMQEFVKTSVLPKLDVAVNRLSHAVQMADSTTIQIDTGEELMEVDCGEIYAFRASVYALQAAFNILVAYNMDMVGLDNNYDWIGDLMALDHPPYDPNEVFDYHLSGTTLTVYKWSDWYYDGDWLQTHRDEMVQKVFKYNLDNNSNFTDLSEPARLLAAKNALLDAVADIIAGSDYILAETDTQSDDVIKIENILSFNDEHLPPSDEDGPNFVQNWDTINDICNWFNNFLTGSIQMHENNVDFSINVSAFFAGNLQQLKDYLPYFHWHPLDESWISPEFAWDYSYNTQYYGFNYQGEYIQFDNLTRVNIRYYDLECEWGYFTTPSGQELAEDEYAYLPDYTFNGIFPDMTRDKYLALFD